MFLIYGEDEFLIKMYKNKILKKINPDNIYYLKEYNYLEDNLIMILNDANTISFFYEKRIIIINNSYFITNEKIKEKFNNKKYLTNLVNYLIIPNPSTFIIFICPTSNINNNLKITKKMLSLNNVLKATNLSYNELIEFIGNYIIKNNGIINQKSIIKIIEYLPNNLFIIKNEIKKLLLINKIITNDLIENNITKYLDVDIFKLVNYLLKDDLNNFLINFNYLKERGLNVISLLILISKRIICIRNIIILSSLNKNLLQISEILQINYFLVKKNYKYINNFSIKKANKLINKLFWIDYNFKKGLINKKNNSDLYLIKLFDINKL